MISLAEKGGRLVEAVRIERGSEIRTFLEHVSGAGPRKVLVLGDPAPALARIEVVPVKGAVLIVERTARAYRIAAGGSEAWLFEAPALDRWIEDRVAAPQYALRKDLEGLLERFRRGIGRTGSAEAPPAKEAAPLLANGGFEKGKRFPEGWDPVDNLTTFWGREPGHGRILRMDTDVLESEWLRRKRELAENPDAPPWPKSPVDPGRQYATVGATYGVSYYSDFMPVRKGQAYRLTLEFRAVAAAGGQAKVWVRGYGRIEVRGRPEWRRIYDSVRTLRTDDSGWHTYTHVFHPTKNTPLVERMRVMLYGYWPRGEYRWDNVAIRPITAEEYRRAKATERADVK